MKKLNKLLLLSYFGPFFLTFVVVMFIFIMQWFWKYIDELVGKGLDWYVIVEITFYASANLIPLALPLSILLSSLMVFGNLSERNELTAAKSAGIPLQRIMMPIIIITMVWSVFAFFFSNNLWPKANLKFAEIMYSIRQVKPALDIKPGVFYKGIDGYVIKIGDKNRETQAMKDIVIFDKHVKNINRVIKADNGTMKMSSDKRYLIITLQNGASFEDHLPDIRNRKSYPMYRNTFRQEIIRFELTGFKLERADEELFKDNYQMLNIRQLIEAVDTLESSYDRRLDTYADHITKKFMFYSDTVFNEKLQIQDVDQITTTLIPDTALVDSLHPAHAPVEPAIFYESFTDAEKARALESAMNQARSNKTYLTSVISEFESRKTQINRHYIEWHRKFTLSIACLVLFFIGAPLGTIIRKGGFGMPMVVSIILFLIFYILSMSGEKVAKEGSLSPFAGMWLATMILLPAGIFLTILATTDSAVLETETYKRFFKKLLFRRK